MTDPLPQSSPKPFVSQRRRQPGRRTTRFLVVLAGVVLVGNALVGERGLIAIIRANHEFATLSRLIDSLRTENEGLRGEVLELREEPRIIEDLARRELGLIKPGETLFIVTSPTVSESASSIKP